MLPHTLPAMESGAKPGEKAGVTQAGVTRVSRGHTKAGRVTSASRGLCLRF